MLRNERYITIFTSFFCLFVCLIHGSWNGVIVDILWNIWSLLVLKWWWEDLLCASYVWEETEKQRNKNPRSILLFFLPHLLNIFFLRYQFTTLAMDSRHTCCLCEANIGWNHHLGSQEAASVSFSWYISFGFWAVLVCHSKNWVNPKLAVMSYPYYVPIP